MTTLTELATDTLRIMGVVVGGETGNAEDVSLAVTRLAALMLELPEFGAGRRLVDVDAATSMTADEDQRILCSAGGLTITLPATPSDGARVAVVDVNGAFGASNATLGRNGRKIAGSAANATLTAGGVWVYRADLADWKLVSALTGGSQSPYDGSLDLAISHVLVPRLRSSFQINLDPEVQGMIMHYEVMLRARFGRRKIVDTRNEAPSAVSRSFFGRY